MHKMWLPLAALSVSLVWAHPAQARIADFCGRLLNTMSDNTGSMDAIDYRAVVDQLLREFEPAAISDLTSDQDKQLRDALISPGYNGKILYQQSATDAHNLVYKVPWLKKVRLLTELIDWQGHRAGEYSESITQTSILNTFWGTPRNLRPQDILRLAITQRAHSNDLRLSMVLGPFSNRLTVATLLKLNQSFAPAKKFTVDMMALPAGGFLIIRAARLNHASTEFLRLLIFNLQDRYFQLETTPAGGARHLESPTSQP